MTSTSKAAEDWERIVDKVHHEIGKCISHMELGLFSVKKAQPIHARILQYIPKRVTRTDTHSLAVSLRDDGLFLLINPDYFLQTLSATKHRIAALHHEEQILFLMLPFREFSYAQSIITGAFYQLGDELEDQSQKHAFKNVKWDPRLFRLLADFEVNAFMNRYVDLADQLNPKQFVDLPLPKGASTETLYSHYFPLWQELQTAVIAHPQQPNFAATSHPQTAEALYNLQQAKWHSDHQHWGGEVSYDDQGQQQSITELNIHLMELLKAEMERILVTARESLSIKSRKKVSKAINQQVDRILSNRKLVASDPKIVAAADKEVSAIINQMLLQDPFYGHFLSGCVRQITDTIPTAGVLLLRKYVSLLINPYFFMKTLTKRSDRAGVLKHEALHIMLKHIIQMRSPDILYKRLYNIAADLEVNQYVGHPWSLPKGAILLSSFPHLSLPPNDVAETYYNILLKEMQKDSKAGQAIQQMADGDQHEGSGHSDHRGWEDGGINGAQDNDMDAHELDIERQVRQAADSLSTKQAGKLPGKFRQLLDDWMKKRQPAIDWKREIRLFVSSNPTTTPKKSTRKKNKRYVTLARQSLHAQRLSADVIFFLSKMHPELLPDLSWDMLPDDLRADIYARKPELRHSKDKTIVWHTLPMYAIHLTQKALPDLTYPSWEEVPDQLLRQLQLVRTPLDPDKVPPELVVIVAKKYSHLLPKLSWDDFSATKKRHIKKQFPHIDFPTWPLLPAEEIVELYRRRDDILPGGWKDVPPQLISQLPFYQLQADQPFRIDRILPRRLPGMKKEKNLPRILVIIDTSGSVTDTDIEYLFAEIEGMHKIGVEVHVLQADTSPSLYFTFRGEKPVAGRGGTSFDPAIQWLNDARFGVTIPVKRFKQNTVTTEEVTLRVDGCIYLTDGYASTPTVKPYCKMMWVLTPDGSNETLKKFPYKGPILKLPPYDKR